MKLLIPSSHPPAFGVGATYEWATGSLVEDATTIKSTRYSVMSRARPSLRSSPKSIQRHTPYGRFENEARSRSATPSASNAVIAPDACPLSSAIEAPPRASCWNGSSWGTISFCHRPDKQQIINNWSYSEDGPNPQDLLVRQLGDIHFSPVNAAQGFKYWVCMDSSSQGQPGLATRSWVLHLPGRQHPVYQQRVLQPTRTSCAPRWVLRRSFRPECASD
ncbi:hypothetical protein FRC12_000659 [Ceratobasidium sp. 428]|nr:hypothetical protein FRC12_000659 [Ceratobasidium sp. 428]